MTKQQKKILSISAGVCLLFGGLVFIATPVNVTNETPNEEVVVSEIVSQESVIDEQAEMPELTTEEITTFSITITEEEITTTEMPLITTENTKEETTTAKKKESTTQAPTTEACTTEVQTTEYIEEPTTTEEVSTETQTEEITTEVQTEATTELPAAESSSPYQSLINNMSDNDKYLIYQITYAEAGNQSIEGQRAVIEVILNRVLSSSFPNTVEGVLSQKGQFSTWKARNSVTHNSTQEDALSLVYSEAPILGTKYVYFSTGKFSFATNYVKIGAHWFGTSK